MARVLVVDDDPVIQQLVVMNLELEGHEVLRASTGPEAIDTARSEAPQVVVLDVMLPEVDGFEVCQALGTDEATRDIPVVLLSARALHSDVQRGYDAGAVEYVTKPFDPLDLVAVVERHADPVSG